MKKVFVLGVFMIGSSAFATFEPKVKTSIKAVTYRFKNEGEAYVKIHRGCHDIWKKNYKNFIKHRATQSVEVVSMQKDPNRITALCVTKLDELSTRTK